MMESPAARSTAEIIERLAGALGDRLVALYRFGGGFARGPKVKDRLLLVVDRIDVPTLDAIAVATGSSSEEGRVNLRVLTKESCLCGADAFPAFTLDLCNTRELLHGEDVLRDLQVERRDLRLRLEQSLRREFRELVQAYLNHTSDPRALAPILRHAVRRFLNLLGGVLYAARIEMPHPAAPRAIIEAVDRRILKGKLEVLERLRSMAAYEVAVEPQQLEALYGQALQSLTDAIAYVDQME